MNKFSMFLKNPKVWISLIIIVILAAAFTYMTMTGMISADVATSKKITISGTIMTRENASVPAVGATVLQIDPQKKLKNGKCGAKVTITKAARAVTDSEGKYTIKNLDPGCYTFQIKQAGKKTMTFGPIIVPADGQFSEMSTTGDFRIQMMGTPQTPAGKVNFRVRDVNGNPLAGSAITLTCDYKTMTGVTNANGEASVSAPWVPQTCSYSVRHEANPSCPPQSVPDYRINNSSQTAIVGLTCASTVTPTPVPGSTATPTCSGGQGWNGSKCTLVTPTPVVSPDPLDETRFYGTVYRRCPGGNRYADGYSMKITRVDTGKEVIPLISNHSFLADVIQPGKHKIAITYKDKDDKLGCKPLNTTVEVPAGTSGETFFVDCALCDIPAPSN